MVKIQAPPEPLVLGAIVRFDVSGSDGAALKWSVSPAVGTFDDDTLALFQKPVSPTARITVETLDDSGAVTGSDVVELPVIIPWREGWPTFADSIAWIGNPPAAGKVIPWDDGGNGPRAERLALILYDLLSQLPPEGLVAFEELAILRVASVDGSPAMAEPLKPFLNVILIDTNFFEDLVVDCDGVSAKDKELAGILLHELAHVTMAHRVGTAKGALEFFDCLFDFMLRMSEVFTGGLAAVQTLVPAILPAGVLALPALPLVVGAALLDAGFTWATRDFASEWAEASGWYQPGVFDLDVPWLGVLLPWLGGHPPNAITSWASPRPSTPGLPIHLENRGFAAVDPRDEPLDSLTEAQLQNAGVPTWYAGTNPHEDFAESAAVSSLGPSEYYSKPAVLPNDSRRSFLRSEGVIPDRTYSVGAVLQHLLRPASSGKPGWTVSGFRGTPKPRPALRTSADLGKVAQVLSAWSGGPETHVMRTRGVLSRMALPPQEPDMMHLLRATMRHGTGLSRYEGAETRSSPGNVLVCDDGTAWIVSGADRDGRVASMVGDVDPRSLRPETAVIPRDRIVLQWAPDPDRRDWAAGGDQPTLDLDRVASLWGEMYVERDGDRTYLSTASGFFAEVVRGTGIEAGEDGLPPDAGLFEIRAFCERRGEGLISYVPGNTAVGVGDFLELYGGSAWGVVTRVSDDGRPEEVVVGGAANVGGIVREEPDAVKLRHRTDLSKLALLAGPEEADALRRALNSLDPSDVRSVWRPSKDPRRWVKESNAMTETFSNLNLALNHLVSYVGSDYVEREGTTFASHIDTDFLPIALGLLLERGARAEARAALRPFEEDPARLRDLRYVLGNVAAQAPVQPGDHLVWQDALEEREGIVLSAEHGEATRLFIGGDRLCLLDRRIPKTAVLEAWTPSPIARELHEGSPEIATFYGKPSALLHLVAQRSSSDVSEVVSVEGEERQLFYGEPADLLRLLSLGAPRNVRRVIWGDAADGFDATRERLDGFGEGLRDFSLDEPSPIGTLLLGENVVGAVIVTTAEGCPARILTTNLRVASVRADECRWSWQPSATPRA